MTTDRAKLEALAERIMAYDPTTCVDNRAFEREVELDIAKARGDVPQNAKVLLGSVYSWDERGQNSVHNVPHYLRSVDAAMTLAEQVGRKWGRPFNLVITTACGRAYIMPDDGASLGVNDPLKGEAAASGDDLIGRTARAVTAASLRALGGERK